MSKILHFCYFKNAKYTARCRIHIAHSAEPSESRFIPCEREQGNIILCCNDYLYSTNFDSVLNSNLIDAWHSEQMNNIRLSLLQNHRIGLCEKCNLYQNYSTF